MDRSAGNLRHRRVPKRGLALGFVVGVVALSGAIAQSPQDRAAPMTLGRLTVRPRTAATGTYNPRAGIHVLDSLPYGGSDNAAPRIYVPAQCVGARRCPLLVGLWQPETGIAMLRPLADKYGFIALSPAEAISALWVALPNIRALDVTLKHVLRHFAIDPDRIAIIGYCQTGGVAEKIGSENLDVFSRVISVSAILWYPTTAVPSDAKAEYFIDGGLFESRYHFIMAQELRRRGYPVKLALRFNHGFNVEGDDAVGRWLKESWTRSHPNARPRRPVLADPPLPLTTDVLAKMITFWRRFVQEPDSILVDGRLASLREVVIPIGTERPEIVMTDMGALAARYPSVAAALEAAGLTAAGHDQYRAALIHARVTQDVGERVAGKLVSPASALGRNMAFLNAHPDELAALEQASTHGHRSAAIWYLP